MVIGSVGAYVGLKLYNLHLDKLDKEIEEEEEIDQMNEEAKARKSKVE